MTQDQYGQARDSGYGVHGQVVEDDETGEFQNDEDKPMTRFQKVASALRGDRSDQADQDEADLDQDGTVSSAPDPNGAALGRTAYDTDPDNTVPNSTFSNNTVPEQAAGPDARTGDYWDAQGTRETGQGPAEMTQPDMPPVAGVDAELPASEDEADADPLTSRDEMDGDPLTSRDEMDGDPLTSRDEMDGDPLTTADTLPDTADTLPDTTGVPDAAAAGVATGDTTSASTTGASTAGAGAREELHPGEAAGTLDDLGDLAYGKLLPDAADFTAQWQQIQYKFVDDPHASVTEAADVVAQVTAKLEAAIQERQRAMEARQRAIQEQQSSLRGRWGDDAQADTETLRETLRMYKAFLDQLVGPKA